MSRPIEYQLLYEKNLWPQQNDRVILGSRRVYMITYETETGELLIVQRGSRNMQNKFLYHRTQFTNEKQCRNAVARLNAEHNTTRFGAVCIEKFSDLKIL